MAAPTPPAVDNGRAMLEPLMTLPLHDLQAVANLLQRIILDGQEAQALLNRLAQAQPVSGPDG